VALRVPRILVLQAYDKFPRRQIRFSRTNVYARDNHTCQYCGVKFTRSKLNLDHVNPRCKGGRTTWENVVCSCIECNLQKGGRTPKEAGMKLLSTPRRPTWQDVNAKKGQPRYKEWMPFLDPVAAAYWNTELKDDD
jgi:5-methylcytosine-specific restriction endonuclease McrA